jgi:hypothetical protein
LEPHTEDLGLANSFHEKAGLSQAGFVVSVEWSCLEPIRLCRHPSIRTLLLSDFSLGASSASSVQRVLLPDNRPRFPSLGRELGQDRRLSSALRIRFYATVLTPSPCYSFS